MLCFSGKNNISRARFPTTFRRFPKIFENRSEGQSNVPEHLPRISDVRGLLKTFEEDPKMFR